MESKYPADKGFSAEQLLDPSNPLVLWVVLPAAVLGALGLKRGAILWIMGSVAFAFIF